MNSVWWVSLAALGLVQREQGGEQLTVNQEGRCTSIVDSLILVLIMLLHLQPSIQLSVCKII